MNGSYPVAFDAARPERFERPQVVLRIAILVLLSIVLSSIGIFSLAYLVFPILAAVFVSQKGGERFIQEDGPKITGILRWLLALFAYLALVTDRLPGGEKEPVRLEIRHSGSPTVGSALLRLVYGIPSAIVLAILGIAAGVVWVVAAVWVLVKETYPESLWRFLRGVLRWEARLLSYLASLVEPYPPFSLDTGDEQPAA